MKTLIKTLIHRVVRSDTLWNIFWPLVRPLYVLLATAYQYRLAPSRHTSTETAIDEIIPDRIVKHGPFRGMRYPFKQASWPCLFPRLLGSYEREIHHIVELICNTNYSIIIDVGCAEGYYAVGLALRIPEAKCFAFDIDPNAMSLCKLLAESNSVSDRITFGGYCEADTILSFPFCDKAIIFCDCEGFELELLTTDVALRLKDHDLLVEIHDFINIEISGTIVERFGKTHNIERVSSIDDITKAYTYRYEELDRYDLKTRKVLLAEMRPAIMEWFYMTSRSSTSRPYANHHGTDGDVRDC